MPFWAIFLTAVIAGFIGALDGIGGGLVLVPVLTAFGVDIREAIAVGAISVVVISIAASPGFLRYHLPNLKAVAFLEFFAIIGALMGAVMTGMVSSRFLTIFFGSTVLISGLALWQTWRYKARSLDLKNDILLKQNSMVGSYYDPAEGKTIIYEGKHPLIGSLCMFGVGLIAGMLGGGGGVFIVLVAELVIGFPTKVSLTMSNLMMGTIALASLSVYLEQGLVSSRWVFPIVMGIFPGAFLGAKLLKQLKGHVIRTVFLCVLALIGIQMIYNGIAHFR